LNNKMPFDLIEKLSNESLAQLFEIQQSFRLKVILIGGYSSLEECNTSNLNYVIPSFSKLLVPEFKESKHSVSPGWKQLISLPVIGNVKQKEQYLQILLNGETKFKEYKNYPEYFYPDGAHPNRHSHRLLTDKILQMIT
jgi:hypothetical protein